MNKLSNKGFTLAELLIVLATLAIISTFVVVSFNNSRLTARDTKRVHQIKEIRTALELYYNRHKTYPTVITSGETFSNDGVIYIDPVPTNPTPRNDGDCPDTEFLYAPTSDNIGYNLIFCLGKNSGGHSAGRVTCNNGGCAPFTFDTDAQALFDRFTIDTPSDADKYAMNDLIVSGKGHGWWDKMDVFYVFAIGTNSTNAKLNWKSTSFTTTGSPSWTAYQGFTGNGSSTYLNTNYNPGAGDATNYAVNSGSMGAYIRNNLLTAVVEIGACDVGVTNRIELVTRFNDGLMYTAVNEGGVPTQANSDSKGFYVASRTASNALFITKNGATFYTPNTTSTNMPTQDVYIGAFDNNGAASYYSTKQIAVAFLGAGLTITEASLMSNDINTYMTTIGTNVY